MRKSTMIAMLRAVPLNAAIASNAISISAFCFPVYRRYHSYQHPSPASTFTPTESEILSAALRHVPSQGFSATALSLGARDVGYLDISVNLFPRGVFDLVNYHLVTERLRLKQKIDLKKLEQHGSTEKLSTPTMIRTLCIERLKANSPIIHRWQEALGIMSLGENIPASVSELAKLSDEMWFLAGDGSYDTNWYTKRVMLSGVYASTEIFMTQDKSADFVETWKFLDRRLDDVKLLGSTVSEITTWFDFTAHAFSNVLRSKNVRLL